MGASPFGYQMIDDNGTPKIGISPRHLMLGDGKVWKPDVRQTGSLSPGKRLHVVWTMCQTPFTGESRAEAAAMGGAHLGRDCLAMNAS